MIKSFKVNMIASFSISKGISSLSLFVNFLEKAPQVIITLSKINSCVSDFIIELHYQILYLGYLI